MRPRTVERCAGPSAAPYALRPMPYALVPHTNIPVLSALFLLDGLWLSRLNSNRNWALPDPVPPEANDHGTP